MKKVLHSAKIWEHRKNYRTVVATFITQLNMISVGMCQGYSAVLLPQLLQSGSDAMRIGSEEASWIASLGVLSNPVGALLSGVLMDLCGRRATISYTTVPFIIGWSLIGISDDLYTLCIGRCISGLAIGMASSSYVYIAEISTASSRGFLSAVGPICVSLGVLVVYSLGYVTNWKVIAFVCASTALVTFLATLFVPESPSWLANRGSLSEATNALLWFRKDQSTIDAEMADILETVKISRNSKPRSMKEMISYCRRGVVWKPLIILLMFFVFQELSGIYIVLYYAVDFFHNVGAVYNDYVASIMVGSLRFVVSIVGAVCIQKFSRKLMATTSGLLMGLSMAVAAAYLFNFSSTEVESRPMAWIPLVCVLVNVCASMLGLLQLPWMMIGELFPLAVRGVMGGITSSLAYLMIFLTVKFYPTLKSTLQMDGMMLLFSTAALCSATFAIAFLPETKDKTLFQIERAFSNAEAAESKENLPGSIVTQNIPSVSMSVECRRI